MSDAILRFEQQMARVNAIRFIPAKAPRIGLRLMTYRADLLGAQLSIESRKRGGTEVKCCVARTTANAGS